LKRVVKIGLSDYKLGVLKGDVSMIRLFLSLCLILSSFSVLAETPPPSVYLRSNMNLMVNGKSFSRGWFTGRFDVGDALAANPVANQEYHLHRVWGAWGSGFIWGSLASFLTYTLVASANHNYSPDVALWLTWFPEFLFGLVAVGRSQYHLLRAINIYNGVPKNLAQNNSDLRFASAVNQFAPSIGLKFDF
jgi:hypothetical protein